MLGVWFISAMESRTFRKIDKWSDLVFEYADGLDYMCHKVSLKFGGSYIKSWMAEENDTINPKNVGDICFKYAITAALNHEGIQKIRIFIV